MPADYDADIKAAFELVCKLGLLAAERTRTSDSMTPVDVELLQMEIEQVKWLLDRDVWLLNRDGFSTQFRKVLDKLSTVVMNQPHWSAQIAPLGTLERLLAIYLGRVSSHSEPNSSLDEEVLVSRATERLLGSHAFKLLVSAVAAAVGLAGIGSLIIGGQTFFTTGDLRKTGEAAQTNIRNLVATTNTDVDQKIKLLDAAREKIEQSREQIQETFDNVQREMVTLKDKAVEEVIKKIQADLGKDTKPLRDRIEAAANVAADSLTSIGTTELGPLKERLTKLSIKVGDDERGEQTLRASLAALGGLTPQIAEIEQKIGRAGNYAKAADEAESAERRANEAATNAQMHRESVLKSLEWLDRNIGEQRTRFGESKSKLDDLVSQVSILHPTLCDQPPIESSPWAAQAQLVCIKQHVATLEKQFAAPTESPPKPDVSAFSQAQWKIIQHTLKNLHLYHGRIDGKPGQGTQSAILKWQRSTGQSATGVVTQPQFEQLTTSQ